MIHRGPQRCPRPLFVFAWVMSRGRRDATGRDRDALRDSESYALSAYALTIILSSALSLFPLLSMMDGVDSALKKLNSAIAKVKAKERRRLSDAAGHVSTHLVLLVRHRSLYACAC